MNRIPLNYSYFCRQCKILMSDEKVVRGDNFCSHPCSVLYRKSRPRTPAEIASSESRRNVPLLDSTKEKIRKHHTGVLRPEVGPAISQAKKGKPRTQKQVDAAERRKELGLTSKTVAANTRRRGRSITMPTHHAENISKTKLTNNGGKYKDEHYSPRYDVWRDAVHIRDGKACRHCGITEEEYRTLQRLAGYKIIQGLHAHHIKEWDEYPELRFVVENGLTLCGPCHKTEHERLLRLRLLNKEFKRIT